MKAMLSVLLWTTLASVLISCTSNDGAAGQATIGSGTTARDQADNSARNANAFEAANSKADSAPNFETRLAALEKMANTAPPAKYDRLLSAYYTALTGNETNERGYQIRLSMLPGMIEAAYLLGPGAFEELKGDLSARAFEVADPSVHAYVARQSVDPNKIKLFDQISARISDLATIETNSKRACGMIEIALWKHQFISPQVKTELERKREDVCSQARLQP
jgi:hypothetical protein